MSGLDEIWNRVCETDPRFTKHVNTRGGFTSISPQYQLRVATELWGPFGRHWGLRDLSYENVRDAEGALVWITLDAEFFYPGDGGDKESSFPISSDMPWKANDETRKKLRTDCLSKAMSQLGFSADVFMGLFDDSRYVDSIRKKVSGVKVHTPKDSIGTRAEEF